jgi:uncharacterized phiE125 gp8 family phage protein
VRENMHQRYQVISKDKEIIWKLKDVKNYLRISHDYDDDLIESLIETAIEYAENFTGTFIHKRTVNCFVSQINRVFLLKHSPILKLLSVHEKVKNGKNKINDTFGEFAPDDSSLTMNDSYIGLDIEIEYSCGYGVDAPNALKLGMLKHISSMYELNETVINPMAEICSLYQPYRKIKI